MRLPCALLLAAAVCVAAYDAETEIAKRVAHLRAQCKKYLDPRRPEYDVLIKAASNKNKLYRLFPADETAGSPVTACIPLKVGSSSWRQQAVRVRNANAAKIGGKAVAEQAAGSKTEEFFSKTPGILQVRHPLERLLSSYIFTFRDSTTHRDMTNKITSAWLQQRKDPLTPREGEVATDASGEHPTLTFRQFVNMLTLCPGEYPECQVIVNDGLGHHWFPYWNWCAPCSEAYAPEYVFDMHHVEEDKNWVFAKHGINATFPFGKENVSKHGQASNLETQKEFFGQLTKREIYDLYMKYKLDHDLFNYSPDEFIAMGREEP